MVCFPHRNPFRFMFQLPNPKTKPAKEPRTPRQEQESDDRRQTSGLVNGEEVPAKRQKQAPSSSDVKDKGKRKAKDVEAFEGGEDHSTQEKKKRKRVGGDDGAAVVHGENMTRQQKLRERKSEKRRLKRQEARKNKSEAAVAIRQAVRQAKKKKKAEARAAAGGRAPPEPQTKRNSKKEARNSKKEVKKILTAAKAAAEQAAQERVERKEEAKKARLQTPAPGPRATTLTIYKCPTDVSKQAVIDFYGEENVDCVTMREGRQEGTRFKMQVDVRFKSQDKARAALEGPPFVTEGKERRVAWAKPLSRAILLANCPKELTAEAVCEHYRYVMVVLCYAVLCTLLYHATPCCTARPGKSQKIMRNHANVSR